MRETEREKERERQIDREIVSTPLMTLSAAQMDESTLSFVDLAKAGQNKSG